MKTTGVTLAVIGMIGYNNAVAHDVWLEHNHSDFDLVYGHVGELETLEPEKVRVIRAYSANGREIAISTHSDKASMKVKPVSKPGMITIDYDNGFWTRVDATNWENRSKRHFPGYKDASHSIKFNKNLMAWNNSFSQPVGQWFEIVPLASPLSAGKGDDIKLQVLHNGEPLADAAVEVHGFDDSFKTDKHGKVNVPVNADSQLQYIAVYYRYEAPGHMDADEISLSANLVFNRQ